MQVLITGATGGIGFEFLTHYLSQSNTEKVIALVRSKSKLQRQLNQIKLPTPTIIEGDASQEDVWKELSRYLKGSNTTLTHIINTIGALHNDTFMPEKNHTQLSIDQFEWSFKTNLIPAILLIKHISPFITKTNPSIMAHISAKIGSIEDNNLGGWYSYRAAKAALNMSIKTASIELKRTHKRLTLLALHPGTVESTLSIPFQKTIPKATLQPPKTCIQNLLKIINSQPQKPTGSFWSYTGDPLPW